jgi:hypothetical protein
MNAKLRATTRSFLESVGPIQLRMRTCPSGLWRTTGQESSLTHNDPFIVMSFMVPQLQVLGFCLHHH